MTKLHNRRREIFAQLIADGTELRKAFGLAGFTSAEYRNYNRLMRHPDVAARIDELKRAREDAARAAQAPAAQVLAELGSHGVDRIADLFEADAGGALRVRDLRAVRVEVALAFVRLAGEALGLAGLPPISSSLSAQPLIGES
jgi:hypothetical protein